MARICKAISCGDRTAVSPDSSNDALSEWSALLLSWSADTVKYLTSIDLLPKQGIIVCFSLTTIAVQVTCNRQHTVKDHGNALCAVLEHNMQPHQATSCRIQNSEAPVHLAKQHLAACLPYVTINRVLVSRSRLTSTNYTLCRLANCDPLY